MFSRIIVTAATALALSACFEMKQDVEVRSDGTAQVATRMAVEASVVNMAGNGSTFCQKPLATPESEKVEMSFERTTEGSMVVCNIIADGTLDDLSEWLEAGSYKPASTKQADNFTILLNKTDNGYTFDVNMTAGGTPPPSDGDPAFANSARSMAMAFVAGKSIEWSFKAPRILSTTGRMSEDGSTAYYSIPVADLISETEVTHNFVVEFDTSSGWLPSWISNYL